MFMNARTYVVHGPRLSLGEFRRSDFAAVHEFIADPVMWRHGRESLDTEDDTRAFIASAIDAPPGVHTWAVLDHGLVIGSSSVTVTSERDRTGEIGYLIRPELWGRGYATEVGRMLLDLGFDMLDLERLTATCSPDNIASARVLEKLGMRFEGRLIGHVKRADGTRRDSLLFASLRTERPDPAEELEASEEAEVAEEAADPAMSDSSDREAEGKEHPSRRA